MNGTIISRGNSYRIQISLGKNPQTGKYDKYTETFKGNKTQAQKRLRELLVELDKGAFTKPEKLTVREYIESWLKNTASPSRTHQGYDYNVHKYILPAIGNIPLVKLKSEDIQAICTAQIERGRYRTAQILYATLSKALNDAIKMKKLIFNPCKGFSKPKVERRELHPMNEDQVNNYLESIENSEYYEMFFLDLFSGMRRAEFLALRWKDVDLLAMTASVNRTLQQLKGGILIFKPPKTEKSRRLISLSPATCIVLREYKAKQEALRKSIGLPPLTDNDLVFCHLDGNPYLPDTISHVWRKLVRRNGLTGTRLHDARHTFATIHLKRGTHPKIVQEMLGHSSINTTLDTYSHVVPGLQAAAAASFDSILKPKENKLEKKLKELVQ